MKEQREKLYLLSLACRLSEKQAKELYGSNVLTPEQYISLTELMSKSKDELNQEKEALKEKIAEVEMLEIEQKRNSIENRERIISENKAKISTMSKLDNEKKAKLKKYGILGTIITVLIITFGFGLSYLFANYIGFTDADLADYAIVSYEKTGYETNPRISGNWDYYSEGGYYDDSVEYLVDTGIYTEEEARKLMPTDKSVFDIQAIVTGYELSTEKSVKNGDVIEAKILYNEEEAKRLKIKVTNNSLKFTISGLREHVKPEDITAEMKEKIKFDDAVAIEDVSYSGFFGSKDYKVINREYYLLSQNEESMYGGESLYYVVELQEIVDDADDEPSYEVAYVAVDLYKTDKEIYIENEENINLNQVNTEYGDLEEFVEYKNYYNSQKLTKIETGGN